MKDIFFFNSCSLLHCLKLLGNHFLFVFSCSCVTWDIIRLWEQKLHRLFISRLCGDLFSMFLGTRVLTNLLFMILNGLFSWSHAISKRFCPLCSVSLLCLMLCIGKSLNERSSEELFPRLNMFSSLHGPSNLAFIKSVSAERLTIYKWLHCTQKHKSVLLSF